MPTDVIEGEVRELTVIEPHALMLPPETPAEVLARARDQANALMGVVRQGGLSHNLGGNKDHLSVEAWQFIANMNGCTLVIESCSPVDYDGGGWEARAVVRRHDGAILSAAESQCTRSESKWSRRDGYALRGMAQTRAMSRAGRTAFAFVAVLAGFDPTTAEEMPPAPSTPPRRDPDRDMQHVEDDPMIPYGIINGFDFKGKGVKASMITKPEVAESLHRMFGDTKALNDPKWAPRNKAIIAVLERNFPQLGTPPLPFDEEFAALQAEAVDAEETATDDDDGPELMWTVGEKPSMGGPRGIPPSPQRLQEMKESKASHAHWADDPANVEAWRAAATVHGLNPAQALKAYSNRPKTVRDITVSLKQAIDVLDMHGRAGQVPER